ncbi:hypothetical protein RCOM_1600860 [Ricinus communis]|uniref:Uncharacterized protein n=2 Tax=Ricinus communis TaxID=3988 RepID=B9R8L7_RICCO|nr:hypothetical protein RCOM_1600860 [Ricinus communis]
MGNVLSSPALPNGVDYVGISSWWNFGLYDIDFGWGKPMWDTYAALSGNLITQFMKLFILMDARMKKGIEAWVFLDEQDIAVLGKDKELLAYASLNPSPFELSMHA